MFFLNLVYFDICVDLLVVVTYIFNTGNLTNARNMYANYRLPIPKHILINV